MSTNLVDDHLGLRAECATRGRPRLLSSEAHQVRNRYKTVLAVGDVAAAAMGLWLGGLLEIARGSTSDPWRKHWPALLLLAAAWVLALAVFSGYTPRPGKRMPIAIWLTVLSAVGATVAWIATLYILAPHALINRGFVVPATAVVAVLATSARLIAGKVIPRQAFEERLLLLGNSEQARLLVREIGNGSEPFGTIAGVVATRNDGRGVELGPQCPVLGEPEEAPALVGEHSITGLILCEPSSVSERIARCIANCERRGAWVASMERVYETLTQKAPILHVGNEWQTSLETVPRTFYVVYIKRAFDVLLATAGLVLSAPIILLAAAAIKLTSRGPAFYCQERIGKDSRQFTFAKLRTMIDNAEADTGPVWATEDDPRVTPVGRFLRTYRIDELPQLWNVVMGDMSLIGPRPERPHFVEQFREAIPLYDKRLIVPPGITGWAQVMHKYDECVEDVIEKLRYDLFYVRHLSVKTDLLILFRTIGVVLSKKGAR